VLGGMENDFGEVTALFLATGNEESRNHVGMYLAKNVFGWVVKQRTF